MALNKGTYNFYKQLIQSTQAIAEFFYGQTAM